jgi:hypothetical protein
MKLEIDNIEFMKLILYKDYENYNINEIIHEKRHHFNKILILSR